MEVNEYEIIKLYLDILRLKFDICKKEKKTMFIIRNKNTCNVKKRNKVDKQNIIVTVMSYIYYFILYIPMYYVEMSRINTKYYELSKIINDLYMINFINKKYIKDVRKCIISANEICKIENTLYTFNRNFAIIYIFLYPLYNYINTKIYNVIMLINMILFMYYNIIYYFHMEYLKDSFPDYIQLKDSIEFLEHYIK